MGNEIKGFKGKKYYFLNNNYNCIIEFNGEYFNNAESAYQAQKYPIEEREEFYKMNGAFAKQKAKDDNKLDINMENKEEIMYQICKRKFEYNSLLAKKLLGTNNAILINSTDDIKDLYWGVDKTTSLGYNILGKILMRIREELKKI